MSRRRHRPRSLPPTSQRPALSARQLFAPATPQGRNRTGWQSSPLYYTENNGEMDAMCCTKPSQIPSMLSALVVTQSPQGAFAYRDRNRSLEYLWRSRHLCRGVFPYFEGKMSVSIKRNRAQRVRQSFRKMFSNECIDPDGLAALGLTHEPKSLQCETEPYDVSVAPH